METVVCNLCGVDESEKLFQGRDRLLGGAKTFQWVRCRRCGLIYLNPRPTLDEMSRYYPITYDPFTYHEKNDESWVSRLSYRVAIFKRCYIASRGCRLGRLLDVGCGIGDFMVGMRRRGWTVRGLDISSNAVTLARQKGLDVFEGQLLDAPYDEQSFDLITMWDVLEHLHDPVANLARVARLLDEDGRFVLTLPNPHSIDFRVFGPIWAGLDVPRHLYVFVRPALLAMLQQVGLEVKSIRCVTGGQRVSTWSLEWLIDERVSGQKARHLLRRLIYSQIWYWVWRPYYFLVDLLGLGSSVTYTCGRAA